MKDKSWQDHYDSAVSLIELATDQDTREKERPVLAQLAQVEATLALVIGLGAATAGSPLSYRSMHPDGGEI